MATVEKLTLENMGVAFGILSLGGTETEIHLGSHLPPNCNVRFKKYHCNTRVKKRLHHAIGTELKWTEMNRTLFCPVQFS